MKFPFLAIVMGAALLVPVAHSNEALPMPAPVLGDGSPPAADRAVRGLTDEERAFASKESSLIQQIRLLDLELEVAERQAKLSETNAPAPHREVDRPVDLVQASSAPSDVPSIRLLSTWGTPGALRAEIRHGSHARTVREGEVLTAGMTIKAIRAGEIELQDRDRVKTYRLDP